MSLLITAILLGIVEGLTEFIPVSSTGHLILASELFGYSSDQWATFNIVIQLGAILAVIVLYWRTFWAVMLGMLKNEAGAWRFVRNILLAFFPAVLLGLAFYSQIEIMLGAPMLVAVALILGGVAILVLERLIPPQDIHGVADIPAKRAIAIGLIQCLAMVPGVSRSGASIMGALALGVERRTAAEFSFFLAIPTMVGATTLELWSNRAELATAAIDWSLIGVGFTVSFVVALIVIRWFVGIVSKHGFAPFAWYRIVAGVAAMAWLMAR